MQESPALPELSVPHSRWVFASCQWLRGGGCAEQTSHGLQCPAPEGAGVSASSRVFLGVFSPSESRGCFWSFVPMLPTAQLCADSLGSLLNWGPVLGAGWRGWIPAGYPAGAASSLRQGGRSRTHLQHLLKSQPSSHSFHRVTSPPRVAGLAGPAASSKGRFPYPDTADSIC